jgi:hypothetical protein
VLGSSPGTAVVDDQLVAFLLEPHDLEDGCGDGDSPSHDGGSCSISLTVGEVLDALAAVAESEFGGLVERTCYTSIYIARRA